MLWYLCSVCGGFPRSDGRVGRTRSRLGPLVIVIAGLALVLAASPVAAADPVQISIALDDQAAPVEITEQRDLVALYSNLCSEQRAGGLGVRPAFEIVIVWSDDPRGPVWRGKLYPAFGDRPAAVDIPEWRLYSSGYPHNKFCDSRLVDAGGLEVLVKYGVPMRAGAPAAPARSPMDELPQATVWLIVSGGAVLLAVPAGLYVIRKRVAS